MPGQIGPLPDLARAIACGNGVIDSGESCDDGNVRARDGCSLPCQVETCASCTGEPSSCASAAKPCLKCARTIAAEGLRVERARATARAVCEIAKIAGKLPAATVCDNEPKAARKIAKASARMRAKIAGACGGADKRCGTNDRDEVALSALAWPETCPSRRDDGCETAIDDCNDVGACLDCLHASAVSATAGRVFADLRPSLPRSEKRLNKCQEAIGKAVTAGSGARATALHRCWNLRARQRHTDDCESQVGVSDAARATAASIALADSRMRARICRACGGADAACDGVDDLTPHMIGFTPFCDAVVTTAGRNCWGAVATLSDLVDCVSYVAEFHGGCADAARVPEFIAYPETCNPSLAPCCEAHEQIGCEEDTCMACVCERDPYCCQVRWDARCAGADVADCAAGCSCGG